LSSVGVPSSQILVIPGAVSDTISLEKRKFPVNSKLLFVGRYERRKGIEELLQVVASMPELEISFVGAIPSSKRINRSNVRYYGEVKDVNTLNEIFDEHTFLIIPSHSEGMPNVILEGMSRGLVSLATDVGAVRELVTSANGIIFEPKSTSAIKSTIETALSLNAWQVESLSTNAMKTIQSKFIWSRIISKTLETFQHVV
jgi:glycosyltransferase involved in cell wall biosynthesis